ncbi:MAG TPA: DUF2971 domain-containing protein [Chthoniobacterales bacterium]|nr:DUF2971 domain-containing protein [Chthoniobacterales bacterium]
MSKFVLERVCFGPDFYREERSRAIGELLRLSEPIAHQLKKFARNRDLSIDVFRKAFLAALAEVSRDTALEINWTLFTELAADVITKQLPRSLEEQQYVASFSTDATNPTMWGHYASAESGFVVVYESTDCTIHVNSPITVLSGSRPSANVIGATELGFYRDEHLKLHRVVYRHMPPKVNAFHRLIHQFSYSEEESHYDVPEQLYGDAPKKKDSIIGLVKFTDWSYEDEVRAFFPNWGVVPPDIRVLRVSPRQIRGLIFGPRMSQSDKARAVICCHLMVASAPREAGEVEEQGELSFFQARQLTDRFAYKILPVGVLEGSFFHDILPIKEINELDEPRAAKLREMASVLETSRLSRRRRKALEAS